MYHEQKDSLWKDKHRDKLAEDTTKLLLLFKKIYIIHISYSPQYTRLSVASLGPPHKEQQAGRICFCPCLVCFVCHIVMRLRVHNKIGKRRLWQEPGKRRAVYSLRKLGAEIRGRCWQIIRVHIAMETGNTNGIINIYI